MTIRNGKLSRRVSVRSAKGRRRARRTLTTLPPSDLYENGKRVRGLPTIFEQQADREQQAIQQLWTVNPEKLTPTEALKTLTAIRLILGDSRKAG